MNRKQTEEMMKAISFLQVACHDYWCEMREYNNALKENESLKKELAELQAETEARP